MARLTSSSQTKSSGVGSAFGAAPTLLGSDTRLTTVRPLSDSCPTPVGLVSDSGLKPRVTRNSSIRRESASALIPEGAGGREGGDGNTIPAGDAAAAADR